jgi:hypothetical protein
MANLGSKHGGALRSKARVGSRGEPALVATWATTHPALIPHEAAGSSRKRPPIPATPVSKRPALSANPRLSPLSPEAPRPACHAGGRGFESRRSRLSKYLETSTFRLLVRRGTHDIGQQTGSTRTRGRRLVAHKLPANELFLLTGIETSVRSGLGAVQLRRLYRKRMTSGHVKRTCRCAAGKATTEASPSVSTSTPPWALNTLRRIARCSASASA